MMILPRKRTKATAAGLWQQEQQCGDCGVVVFVGEPQERLPESAWPRTGPKCTTQCVGSNKICGWPTTVLWLFRRRAT